MTSKNNKTTKPKEEITGYDAHVVYMFLSMLAEKHSDGAILNMLTPRKLKGLLDHARDREMPHVYVQTETRNPDLPHFLKQLENGPDANRY